LTSLPVGRAARGAADVPLQLSQDGVHTQLPLLPDTVENYWDRDVVTANHILYPSTGRFGKTKRTLSIISLIPII
jgi:hypothetical protein